MFRLVLAWLILASLTTLLVFQVSLHSDLLFLDGLMTDLFRFGGRWQDWKLTPAPAYVPDMLLYAVGYLVMPNPVTRIAFVSISQALLLAYACNWLAVTIQPTISRSARVVVVLLVATVVMVATRSNMWLFFYSTNNHFAGLLFSLLGTGCILRYLEKPAAAWALLLLAGSALAKASTSVFAINFTLPLLCLLLAAFVILRGHRQLRWRIAQLTALMVVSQMAASGLDRLLISHDALQARVPFSVDAALLSGKAFLDATRTVFAPDNRYSFSLSLFILGCLIWVVVRWLVRLQLVRNKWSDAIRMPAVDSPIENWRYDLCVVFLLTVLPLNVLAAIASGGFGDIYGYRYFAFPLCLGVLLWVLLMDSGRTTLAPRIMALGSMAGLVCLPLYGALSANFLFQVSGRHSLGEFLAKGNLRLPATGDAVGACLDRIAANGFPLGSGMADFWYTRSVIYKVSQPLYILQILNNGMPFFHMTTIGPLIDPGHYGLKPYNFVIMRQPGSTTQFDLKADTLGRLLPSPERIVSCQDSDADIWLYSNTSLDTFVRQQADLFLRQVGEVRADAGGAGLVPLTVAAKAYQ